METNKQKLEAAFFLAIEDKDFMGNSSKVNKAIEALTPKDTLTAVMKRLQGNARRDFLDKKDQGVSGYTDENKADKMKEYVSSRFKDYMESPKTAKKATEIFNKAYPVASQAEREGSDSVAE